MVADLEARGYVDDRAFALAWADSRARGRALGSRRLRQELLAKGVARPLVDEAVAAACGAVDEEARARAAAARRLAALGPSAPGPAARRLGAYLLRRGFSGDLVRRVVREACGIPLAAE